MLEPYVGFKVVRKRYEEDWVMTNVLHKGLSEEWSYESQVYCNYVFKNIIEWAFMLGIIIMNK
jgi:hypothetical protein